MSTKAHILYETGIEVYEETIEPQAVLGRVTGYNIYFMLDFPFIETASTEGQHLVVETKNMPHLPEKVKIWFGDILKLEFNWKYDHDMLIVFKGGSRSAEHISKGDYSFFES